MTEIQITDARQALNYDVNSRSVEDEVLIEQCSPFSNAEDDETLKELPQKSDFAGPSQSCEIDYSKQADASIIKQTS